MRLRDGSGRWWKLGALIKQGGEGAVHEVEGSPQAVAKVYSSTPEAAREQKLRALLARASPALDEVAAWPSALLYNGPQFCGFIMPRASGREIHQLFNPSERARQYPSRRWDFLLHVARNCADAFATLHAAGVVVGDVNEGNVLVADDGRVRLIDCDSYQVEQNGRVFTCDVGVDQWTPPELQGLGLAGRSRTANHDLFGLAVLIFKIVFMGRHPYAGIPLQPGDFELEEAIKAFRFAFSPRAAEWGVRPPPYALGLETFPASVTHLFEAAFLQGSEKPGARPDAARWRSALEVIKRNLIQCGSQPAHLYTRNQSARCPWCEISRAGGPDYFDCVPAAPDGRGFTPKPGLIDRIEAIGELAFTVPTFATIVIPEAVPQPLPPEALGIREGYVAGWAVIAAAVFFGVTIHGAWMLLALLGAGLIANGTRSTAYQQQADARRAAASKAEAALRTLLAKLEQIRSEYQALFRLRRTQLQAECKALKGLPEAHQRELEKLKRRAMKGTLDEFLARHLIADDPPHGFGAGRLATLVSYGIETARDIQPRMNIPGIGCALQDNLLAWRRRIEARFVPQANARPDQAAIAALDARFAEQRRTIERNLEAGGAGLAALNDEYQQRFAAAHAQLASATLALALARANLKAL